MRRLRQIIMNRLLLRLVPVVREQDHLVVDLRLQMHGAAPDLVDVLQRVDGVLDLDVQAVVLVGQVQLAAVGVVAVGDLDEGLAHVG